MFDLAARGWVRIVAVDDEVIVLTDGHGAQGDVLTAYEQQVLNHLHRLTAGTVNGVTGAGIEVAGLRLERRWWRRFSAAVAADARRQDLCRRRWNPLLLVVPAALVGIAGWQLWRSVREGDETAVSESLLPRAAAVVVAIVDPDRRLAHRQAGAVAGSAADADRACSGPPCGCRCGPGWSRAASKEHRASSPTTPAGRSATPPPSGSPSEPPPNCRSSPRTTARRGATPPGRGTSSRSATRSAPASDAIQLLVLIVGLVRRHRHHPAADASCSTSPTATRSAEFIDDNFADQEDIIHNVALGLPPCSCCRCCGCSGSSSPERSTCSPPIERRGLVVRARRPQRVVPYPWLLGPLARRDRYSLFVAVDDGRSDRVSAWLANERTAVPQGARARVRATPLLGYVRSAEPIGTQ